MSGNSKQQAILALEDGSVFYGTSIGTEGISCGEVVFNTAMSGYQEILTDPSYASQLITLTCPHVGNTGTNPEDEESTVIHAAGLIIRDMPLLASNFRNTRSLSDYLNDYRVVGIADIDTRRLTRLLREKGAQRGCLMAGETDALRAIESARAFPGLKGMDLAKEVTTATRYDWREGSWRSDGFCKVPASTERFRVVAYDFGIKRNILRMLFDRGCQLTVVPAQTPVDEVLAFEPDGVFLSNGPGDPEPCDYAIESIASLLASEIPLFGICLGHQLLALACGAATMKMKFGHHGANHPVLDLDSGTVLITSQNHGFAVDERSLSAGLRVTHRSLFDQSIQGIECVDKPAFGFQGHPEASPGPHDASSLFDRFIGMMRSRAPGAEPS